MKNLAQYLALIAILFLGCADHDRINPLAPAEKLAAFEQSALQDSLPQNISVTLSDLLGRELPDGEVSISYFYVDADTTWLLNEYQGPSNAIKFYGAAFPGDFDGNGIVDYADFYKFADAFGRKLGQTGFDPLFDFDGDGQVSWQDFWVFADFFNSAVDGAQIASAKPITLPAEPPTEGIGQMSYTDLLKAWPSLKRAAKVAAVNRHYQFRVKSLDKVFADTTVNVSGEIFGPRQFAFSVNAAPHIGSLSPRYLTFYQDSIGKMSLYQFLTDNDDQLNFKLAGGDTAGFSIKDNFLIVPMEKTRQYYLEIKATDTAKQSEQFDLTVSVVSPPVPPDTQVPVVTAQFVGALVSFQIADESDSVEVTITTLTNGVDYAVYQNRIATPVNDSVKVDGAQGTYPTTITAVDKAGNKAELKGQVVLPDKTPPQGNVSYEWVGDRKNQLAVSFSFSDNTGLADYRVIAGTLDYSGNAGGRQNLNFSPSDASFPTVASVTTREIKLHSCDQAGNCSDQTVPVDQPISPAPPPPPPVVVATPPPVTHTASEARLNNVAPGSTLQMDWDAALNGSAPISGDWNFFGIVKTGSSASDTARNGTVTFTYNGASVSWTVQATPPLDP